MNNNTEIENEIMLDYEVEYAEKIQQLPLKARRLAILSMMDEDRNLFLKIKNNINTHTNKVKYTEDVLLMLREYAKVSREEQRKFSEITTPLNVVKDMLDILPEEVWQNPYLKWFDCSNGIGPFPLLILNKLMMGLQNWEPDEEKRYKHILEKMLYVCELQNRNNFLFLSAVDPYNEYKINIFNGSFLSKEFDICMKYMWGIEKFDIVLSNPPYCEEILTKKGSVKPLYHKFTDKAVSIGDKVLLITPSRWFSGGKGLDKFRTKMLTSNKLKIIRHFNNAEEIFGNYVEIKGGVSYFLYDNNYTGLCNFNDNLINLNKYDVVVDSAYYSVLEKVLKFKNITEIYNMNARSSIQTNDKRLTCEKPNDDYIKCYVSKIKGFINYINKIHTKNIPNKENWKVYTPRAATKGGEGFGNIFIGEPGSVASHTYRAFNINNEQEAFSLVSYLQTNFANNLLSLRKISQHIKAETCKWIPLVPLDREWNDEKIAAYFKLTAAEIELICRK